MRQDRDNIDILFRLISPSMLIRRLHTDDRYGENIQNLISEGEYSEIYSGECGIYTPDEIRLRYIQLCDSLEEQGGDWFALLWKYGNDILMEGKNGPLCKLSSIHGWNSLTLRTGEDLITCSWAAHRDIVENNSRWKNTGFIWSPTIKTDDYDLNKMLQRGLAENHYHLNGSTQSFALSWIYLMNHPMRIRMIFKDKLFSFYLTGKHITRYEQNTMPWESLISYAAYIRVLLFRRFVADYKVDIDGALKEFQFTRSLYDLNDLVTITRQSLGYKFQVRGCEYKNLDYAISTVAFPVDDKDPCRTLAGERSFLYHCFSAINRREASNKERLCLHIYLLIKNSLLNELIMNNNLTGFSMFKLYQDRKDLVFFQNLEYNMEALRLSAGTSIKKQNVRSLEARIMPKAMKSVNISQIRKYNFGIKTALEGDENSKWFFVMHFPKERFSYSRIDMEKHAHLCRNQVLRKNTEIKARALAELWKRRDEYSKAVRGIDACSVEIGCRPETFATEFRYLRNMGSICNGEGVGYKPISNMFTPGITYHVGEDFIDIIDGLRAVDEAIEFLELEKHNRIGHGTVLGLDVSNYYKVKGSTIYIEKQDLLDNMIWLFFRTLDWGIEISSNAREKIRDTALRLVEELYSEEPKNLMNDLRRFYDSWKLRGDHPSLYFGERFCYKDAAEYNRMLDTARHYDFFKTRNLGNDNRIRFDKETTRLYYRYHYDGKVKYAGCRAEAYKVEDWYVDLAQKMQKEMRRKVYNKGITVECNPTSNYLISMIDRYDKHPIWTMCNHELSGETNEPQLSVCINTDDIGVFSTSLEKEYALLLVAECKRRRLEDGCENDLPVYEYLERIRENGFQVAFI
ncbi:MAG: hypothetical protein J6I76_07710 [Oribacterium sp.]|nr:hypothetical protein [Oribacterium sp.]